MKHVLHVHPGVVQQGCPLADCEACCPDDTHGFRHCIELYTVYHLLIHPGKLEPEHGPDWKTIFLYHPE